MKVRNYNYKYIYEIKSHQQVTCQPTGTHATDVVMSMNVSNYKY